MEPPTPTPTPTPTITLETPLKFLDGSGRGRHSGKPWKLPSGDQPGPWMRRVSGELELCRRGYHVTTAAHAAAWFDTALYVVEVDGDSLDGDTKSCHARARLLYRVEAWNARTARLLACDYAERVLEHYEAYCPGDSLVRDAVAVARRFAVGGATVTELRDAHAAARAAAATTAARAAAYAATTAARAAEAAAYAAETAAAAAAAATRAATTAATTAARAAAYAAADADAADAADAAAANAANAADAAAAAAANAAAAVASGGGAVSERAWQTERFLAYVNGHAPPPPDADGRHPRA